MAIRDGEQAAGRDPDGFAREHEFPRLQGQLSFVVITIKAKLYVSIGRIFFGFGFWFLFLHTVRHYERKKRKASSKTLIKDIKISYDAPWQKLHWKSITSAYRSSSYLEFFEDYFIPFYEKQEVFLLDFNLKLKDGVLKCLQTKDSSILTQSYQKQSISNDYRNATFQIKNQTKYHQVFENNCGFIANLSIIDLLFNLGPESADYLENLDIRIEI